MVKAIRDKLNGHLNKVILAIFVAFIGWIAVEVVSHGREISTNAEKCMHNETAIGDLSGDINELKKIGYRNQALLEQLSK